MDIADLTLSDRDVWDDTALTALRDAVQGEYDRRVRRNRAARELDQLLQDSAVEDGRVDGDAWVQPHGAFDAYPSGAVVTHDGKSWRSLVSGNSWEPGVSSWRELTPDGAAPGAWVQPTGYQDAYNAGEHVMFDGHEYVSVIDRNTWSPADYPRGWQDLTPDTGGIPDFVQPTGGHDTYQKGDRVMFEGSVWESLIDNNAYSPADYAQGWQKVPDGA